MVQSKFAGERMGIGGGESSVARWMVCKQCLSRSRERTLHAVLGRAGKNQQCMVCRKTYSSNKSDWKDQNRVCCKVPQSAENSHIGDFVNAVLTPVKDLLERYGLTMSWNYNMDPTRSVTVDVPITVRDRSGRVVALIALELDTEQHKKGGTWQPDKERSRVKEVLEGYKTADGSTALHRGMIHFSMIGSFTVGGTKHELKDALTRWLILQSWVIDAVLRRARYPKVWALYLFYDDDNERIVWPIRGGVCGNACNAPKDDLSVGDGASVADWGSVLDPALLLQSFNNGGDGREFFSIDRLVVRRDVFGATFGPSAKCADREDRLKVYRANE